MKMKRGMGNWKLRKLNKGLRASRTPGSKKGLVPPSWARGICRRNRSYKNEFYSKWNKMCDGGKIKWSSGA